MTQERLEGIVISLDQLPTSTYIYILICFYKPIYMYLSFLLSYYIFFILINWTTYLPTCLPTTLLLAYVHIIATCYTQALSTLRTASSLSESSLKWVFPLYLILWRVCVQGVEHVVGVSTVCWPCGGCVYSVLTLWWVCLQFVDPVVGVSTVCWPCGGCVYRVLSL